MTARVGSRQIELLILLASPFTTLMTPDKGAEALARRGLLRQDHYVGEDGVRRAGGHCITPAGLRALADAMEAGRVPDAIERMKRDADARRAKAEGRGKRP